MNNIFTILLGIIAILIFIWRIRSGFRNGFVGEIIATISTIVAFLVAKVLFSGFIAFLEGRVGKMVYSIIILSIIMAVFGIANLILRAIKLVVKLPVIKGIDKLLGVIAGLIEAFLIVVILLGFIKLWL